MSLIRWVGFVEGYVLEEDIYLQILNQQDKKCTQAVYMQVKEVREPHVEPVTWKCSHSVSWRIPLTLTKEQTIK